MSFIPEADQPDPAAGPDPGTPENPVQITDPMVMRGLAHPARIAIFEHLVLDGPATATECAGVAGLSPSACSYHLRALARYGFAEEDPHSAADGRHRPWRAKISAFSFGENTGKTVAAQAAGRVLRDSVLSHYGQVRRRYYDRQDAYPEPWQAALGTIYDYVHVTPDELAALDLELRQVLGRYRRLDSAGRPGQAERIQATVEFVPVFAPGGDG